MTKVGVIDYLSGGRVPAEWKSAADIVPDLTGKTIIVTGANSGVGKESALEFARKNAHVIMACRSEEKAMQAVQEIKEKTKNDKVEFIKCDLSDWQTVVDFAKKIKERDLKIDVLLNNAGVMAIPKYTQCKQGIELQFSGNHMGHFLLTRELLPNILAAGKGARIVNLSSEAHKWAYVSGFKQGVPFDRLTGENPAYSSWKNYGYSKLANILFTRELGRLLEEHGHSDIYVNAVHPGVVSTNLGASAGMAPDGFMSKMFKPMQSSSDVGAMTQIYASVHPDVVTKNIKCQYLVPIAKLKAPTTTAQDPVKAKELWDWSEKTLKEKGFDGTWAF